MPQVTPCSPHDIISAVRRPTSWDGEVPTYTGRGFRPFAAQPGEVSMDDVIHGLAFTYRYGGHSEPAITVAEHVLLAAEILETLWPDKPHLVKAVILHDAVESYLHDIQAPIRRYIFIHAPDFPQPLSWDENDLRISRHIGASVGIEPEWFDAPEVRAADILAACFERRDCANLEAGVTGLPPIPAAVAHLRMAFDSPFQAKWKLRARMRELGML